MDSQTRRQMRALTALWEALAERGVATRLDLLPIPFLTIAVLHLPGSRIMVHVVLGHAGPDEYVWNYGQRRHDAADPGGAAARLAVDVRGHGSS